MIRRSTWIVFVIFVLLITAVIIWQRSQENKQVQLIPTPAISFLFDLGGKSIVGITISGPGGQTISATKSTDGNWVVESPTGEQADTSRIDAAVGTASGLQVLSTLKRVGDLETLGLNPASYQIELILDDGTRLHAFIGGLTPTQNGYNVYIEGQPLKIVERYSLEEVLSIFNDPPILQLTPTVEDLLQPTIQP